MPRRAYEEAAPGSATINRPEAASGETFTQSLCAFRNHHNKRSRSARARTLGGAMLSDPAAAAWVAADQPPVEAPTPAKGRCGRCGTDGLVVASSRIVSDRFTGFDAWPFGSHWLCTPCAWAYSRPPRTVPAMLISTTTVTEYPDRAGLASVLTAGALPDTHAVLLPASHQRHILPTAQWGHLATDGLVVPWGADAATRLAHLIMLRPIVTDWVRSNSRTLRQLAKQVDSVLHRQTPPFPLLTAQPRARWPHLLAAWTALQPWRTVPPLWTATQFLAAAAATPARSDQPIR
ncbi:hypothetical protein MUNTM_33640 [Mycobacterium sp. MUNTM1]